MEITRQNETQERQKTKPWILPSSWRLNDRQSLLADRKKTADALSNYPVMSEMSKQLRGGEPWAEEEWIGLW